MLPFRRLKFQTSLGYTETLSQRKKNMIINNKIVNPMLDLKVTKGSEDSTLVATAPSFLSISNSPSPSRPQGLLIMGSLGEGDIELNHLAWREGDPCTG